MEASASNVYLGDEDLDLDELGGAISWVEPRGFGSERVEQYRLYFVDFSGSASSLAALPPMAAMDLPAGTPRGQVQALHVYTASSLSEQSTPAFVEISDTFSVAFNLSFPDFDLDFDDLGGTLTWAEPEDQDFVLAYFVYQALPLEDALGLGLCASSSLGSVPISGTVSVSLAGVSAQQLAVAMKAALAQALGIPHSSLVVTVTSSRRLADDPSRRLATSWRVTYQAYVDAATAASAGAVSNSLNTDPAIFAAQLSTQLVAIGVDASALIVQDFGQLEVSSMTEGVNISDDSDQARLLRTEDSDADELAQASGPARRLSSMANLTAWCRGPLLGNVSVGNSSLELPADLQLSPYSHLVIYAASGLEEQTTPAFLEVYDMSASVSNLQFQGKDLDADHLGGNLTWDPPAQLERVSAYVVYLAESAFGLHRYLLDELPPDSGLEEVPADTERLAFNHFTVYTKSFLAEQTTPAALAFFDEFAMASNMSFTDEDLDEHQIGGNLSWYPPGDQSEVTAPELK
ncbi:unnamed protein product [Effrenium voratum]|uniref:Uncharacterized protein n=1 Tax=Effrenium voratum TaxID=2562239 RepID=A0AA36IKM9_9DINO|nr:unnamed protein product [Effrenium voratum]